LLEKFPYDERIARITYVIGHTRPPFGGPASGLITFSLEDKGENETVFKESDATHGHVTTELKASAESEWRVLFTELKTYVEKQ